MPRFALAPTDPEVTETVGDRDTDGAAFAAGALVGRALRNSTLELLGWELQLWSLMVPLEAALLV